MNLNKTNSKLLFQITCMLKSCDGKEGGEVFAFAKIDFEYTFFIRTTFIRTASLRFDILKLDVN